METLTITSQETPSLLASLPTLERIIFPSINIQRHLDEEGLLTKSKKATLSQSTEVEVATGITINEKIYTVLRFIFSAVAEDEAANLKLLDAQLTCHAYFHHQDATTEDEAKEVAKANELSYINLLSLQVYSTAALEFEQAILRAGLPPIRLPLQMSLLDADSKMKSSSS